jgi:hypothetical protein
MRISGFAWECSCGNMEYKEEMPEECAKCGELDSFLKMPEDLLKAREQDMLLDGDDEEPVKVAKAKVSKVSKTKKTTARRKK